MIEMCQAGHIIDVDILSHLQGKKKFRNINTCELVHPYL